MTAMRQQILDAARAVFERKGIAETSMTDVSAQAGVAVGSIYVHFGSKEELLKRLIETAELNAAPFEQCASASEMLGLVESTLKRQAQPSADNQAARTALEVAAFARRNPLVQAIVAKNYETLRRAILDATVRIGTAAGQVNKQEILAIGEALISLLISAQAQMLIGVSVDTSAKIKAARLLMTALHGSPVRAKR